MQLSWAVGRDKMLVVGDGESVAIPGVNMESVGTVAWDRTGRVLMVSRRRRHKKDSGCWPLLLNPEAIIIGIVTPNPR